ncbi:MAG: sugar transferase [Acidimicrobiia bacterium]|nr:sugar transferase [Acidimicrobiia bacterium]
MSAIPRRAAIGPAEHALRAELNGSAVVDRMVDNGPGAGAVDAGPAVEAVGERTVDSTEIRVFPDVADIDSILDRIGRPRETRAHRLVMRVLDIVVSLTVLVVASPLILAIAAVIVLDSRGPAVFRQVRIGRDGRLFHFYKFRTMYADAAERFPHLYAYDHSDDELPTLYFKLADDPRLTRFGRYLRRTSLDELPNFVNVLKGEMTLVGPRPEIPQMVRYYQPHELVKFAVKPGVTGLAQISGRNILRFQETIAHDLEYVRARSLRFDLSVLRRTPGTVVRMIGAL